MEQLLEKKYLIDKERFFELERENIFLFGFLLDSMENVGRLTTIDSKKGLVKLEYPLLLEEDIELLLEYVKKNTNIREIEQIEK